MLEADSGPATLKLAATEDEAVEIKPVKVERPVTDKVEALACPITVEEAVEIRPAKVDSPVTPRVPLNEVAPLAVSVPPVLMLVPTVDE